MSSGYFPLDTCDGEAYERLQKVCDELASIAGEYTMYAHELGCSDDAANDGHYLAYLSLARELVQRTLRKEPTDDKN